MTRTFEALDSELDNALDFIEGCLTDAGCSEGDLFKIRLAAEEIFVNIANYAYTPGQGPAEITVENDEKTVSIIFMDSGKQFNPLNNIVDTDAYAESDKIGGLGIHIVRSVMDEITYEYIDGKNIFTMKKSIA